MNAKYFLIALLSTFCGVLYGQEFAPIGAEWYFSEPNGCCNADYQKYISEKDTLINGKICRFITNRFYPPEIMYEENGSVYYYYLNDFRKIFDYTANEGDIIDFEFKCKILKSDTIRNDSIIMFIGDTAVILQCIVKSITTEAIDEQIIRTFHTTFLEDELFGEPIMSSKNHNYTELFGLTYIKYNEFIPVVTVLAEPAIYGYRNMRCYHDNSIDYIADWWKAKDKPCDEPFSLSIKDYDKNSVLILSPNPVKDQLNVQFAEHFNTEQVTISVCDIMGKYLYEKDYFFESFISIDVANLATGIYFLKIRNKDNTVLTNKFIKL